ncbi:endonuclease domain-containing protein [Sphingomonas sp. So64.6b]|uniref:endonuclease domain-containing protein n=1 Tax=Sphingomonas sp. So64.6b TaxID=2997354 RepID=UPI0016038FDB|nr:DUF559 domain-containing protein [Sphingomonas sp. So64.6b]QNA83367.1 endonuclease domain-containing protein [Sphingomonas sp. So64.6b]
MATEVELQRRALVMRRNPTEPEKRLWRCLSNSQLDGFKFRRQHVIFQAQAIADFFCPSVGLLIEVDGDTHDDTKDVLRDQRVAALGFAVLRFSNLDVMQNADGVVETILAKLNALPERWSGRTSPPQPLP